MLFVKATWRQQYEKAHETNHPHECDPSIIILSGERGKLGNTAEGSMDYGRIFRLLSNICLLSHVQ